MMGSQALAPWSGGLLLQSKEGAGGQVRPPPEGESQQVHTHAGSPVGEWSFEGAVLVAPVGHVRG